MENLPKKKSGRNKTNKSRRNIPSKVVSRLQRDDGYLSGPNRSVETTGPNSMSARAQRSARASMRRRGRTPSFEPVPARNPGTRRVHIPTTNMLGRLHPKTTDKQIPPRMIENNKRTPAQGKFSGLSSPTRNKGSTKRRVRNPK